MPRENFAAQPALLAWAYCDPLPRRFVAALTVLVIYGLIATEVMAVRASHLEARRMIPTRVIVRRHDWPQC